MTLPTSAIAIFCEDIREEKSGGVTLLGVMPDNVNVSPIPPDAGPNAIGLLQKLCVYVRMNFDVESPPEAAVISVIFPDGTEQNLHTIPKDIMTRATEDAKRDGNIIAGIISSVKMQPFPVQHLGRYRIEATVDRQRYVCGTLNFRREASS